MQQEVKLDEITDLDKLKSMAYDQIAIKEQAENNLKAVNQRITQVAQDNLAATKAPEKK
jgi:hypothetical protein